MVTLREQSIRYLSQREHSRSELKQKLLQKQFSEDEIVRELDFLIAHDLQSDERFAHAYVRSRQKAGFGPLRIEIELRQKGISEALIADALNVRSPDWQAQLMVVWQQKYRYLEKNAKNQAEKARQFRFLLQRGYNAEIINKLLFFNQ